MASFFRSQLLKGFQDVTSHVLDISGIYSNRIVSQTVLPWKVEIAILKLPSFNSYNETKIILARYSKNKK